MSDAPSTIKRPPTMSTSVRAKTIRKKNRALPRINLDAANSVAGTPTHTTCTTETPSSGASGESVKSLSHNSSTSPPLPSFPAYMSELPPPELPEPQSKRRRTEQETDSATQACLLIAQSYALGYLSAEKRLFDREIARLSKFRNYLLEVAARPGEDSAETTSAGASASTNSNDNTNEERNSVNVTPDLPAEHVLESMVSDFADKIFSEMQNSALCREDVALLLELVSEAQIPVPSASLGSFFLSVYEQFGAAASDTYSLSSNQPAPGPRLSGKISYEREYMTSDAPSMPICDGFNGGDEEEDDSEDDDENAYDSEDDSENDSEGSEDQDDSESDSEDDSEDEDEDENEDSGNEDDEDVVNTDFDFFDLKTDDFLAIKNLLRSLLESDHLVFDLSKLTDFVIDNGTGLAVKSDGSEGEPLGIFSVVDITGNDQVPKQFQKWLIERTEEPGPEFSRALRKACASKTGEKVGLILQERLLNLPFDLLPYFYQLTLAELKDKGLEFDKYVVLSRVYSLESTGERPAKRSNKPKDFDYFHAEDPELAKLAEERCTFGYKNEAIDPESRGTQENEGLFPRGHALLFSKDSFARIPDHLTQWVDAINKDFQSSH